MKLILIFNFRNDGRKRSTTKVLLSFLFLVPGVVAFQLSVAPPAFCVSCGFCCSLSWLCWLVCPVPMLYYHERVLFHK